jgi:hypothetical protein
VVSLATPETILRWYRGAPSARSAMVAELDAGRTYWILVGNDPRTVNMSAFVLFASFTGGARGAAGEYNRVNIAQLKVPWLTQLSECAPVLRPPSAG